VDVACFVDVGCPGELVDVGYHRVLVATNCFDEGQSCEPCFR
jgi:hypothetical protein